MRRDPRTRRSQPPEHAPRNPLLTPTHHRPQPWVTVPTTGLLRTQASAPDHRPRPHGKRRTPRWGHPAYSPPASQRQKCGPSGLQGAPDTWRLQDEGPHKQPTVPRSWLRGNGRRGLPATLTRRSLQPRRNVPPPRCYQEPGTRGETRKSTNRSRGHGGHPGIDLPRDRIDGRPGTVNGQASSRR